MTRPRRLRAKYPGRCPHCRAPIDVGQDVYWYESGRVKHVYCEIARYRIDDDVRAIVAGKAVSDAR